jgi:hypothetical protein
MKLDDTQYKILIIFFMCLIPWILVVMWTATFVNKTKSDECNAENYKCEAPVKAAYGSSSSSTPTTTIPSSTQPTTNINDDKQKEIGALTATTTTKEGFISSATTDLDATDCGQTPIKRISEPKANSAKTFNAFTTLSIISIVVMVALIVGCIWYYNYIGSGSGFEIQKACLVIVVIISIIFSIMMSVFLGLKNKMYTSAAFHTSIISFLSIIIVAIKYFTGSNWPTWSIVSYAVLGLLTILMLFGTMFIHTFQKDNLEKGKYTHAVNEAISAIVPPFMIIYVLISLLLGVGTIATKGSVPFSITQMISAILLMACIGMYYKYKVDCNNSVPMCRNDLITTLSKDKKKRTISSACIPDTGMTIKTKTIINMGVAMSVLMGINQLIGGIAFGLHKSK